MDERYIRNIPALTEAECATLKKKRVLIAGCGGLGGHLLDMLLRLGVGAIRVCDGDVFDSSNLNRQLLSDPSRLGKSKALTAGAHGALVNPEVHMEVFDHPITEENAPTLLAGCDAALDGLDSVEARFILSRACAQAGVPYVFGAVSGWVAQAAVSMPGDGLIPSLYPQGTASEGKSVLSFTPALCASLQASLCVRLLTGRPVETGRLYHLDLLDLELQSFPLV